MKKILTILIFVILLLTSVKSAFAINNPTSVPNNMFGIHVFSEKDLENAEKLINSSGGDWGYVTIVITESERNHDRWQQVFDQMRRMHLIPIIRLATKPEPNGTWDIPQESEINNWIAFLNSLNWVIQNRYIIIGNEPNHATEWGGTLDPEAYGQYLLDFSKKLKVASPDFFVLPAALDASAKNTSSTMDESKFLKLMTSDVPSAFDYIDGWNSHSYPNPDFSGKVEDTGKGSIRTYDWELSYLKLLGVMKDLPVFITETGWSNKNLTEDEISKNYEYAFQNIWSDTRIAAVTPFILDYPQAPFDIFSWQKADGSFYKFYSSVQNISKVAGRPQQVESGQILASLTQPLTPVGSNYIGIILARNTGQSIWNSKINVLKSDLGDVSVKSISYNDIEPTKLGLIVFEAASPEKTGIYTTSLFLTGSKGQRITNSFTIETFVFDLGINTIVQKLGSLFLGFKLW